MFGAIDRAVLPARTAEAYLQVRKTAFEETLRMVVHQLVHTLQKRQYFPVFLQKINHRSVQSGQLFVFIVLAGVVRTAAVEDIPSAVAGPVCRNTALEGEGIDRDRQTVLRTVSLLRRSGNTFPCPFRKRGCQNGEQALCQLMDIRIRCGQFAIDDE